MKFKNTKMVLLMMVVFFSGALFINAHSLQELKKGDTVCVDTSIFTKFYAYAWNWDGTYHNNDWPGLEMTKEKDSNVRCYVPAYDGYENIIFTNNEGKQTIDLSTIGSGLVYMFEEKDKLLDGSNKYKGEWHIYDKSALVNLVNKVEKLNELDYTYATFNNLLAVLNGDGSTIGAKDLSLKNYKSKEMTINEQDGKFSSTYEDVYNKLNKAFNNLVKRHKIVVKNGKNGNITFVYKNKSDTDITISSQANTGYKLKSLQITNITGYKGDGSPILGNVVKEYNVDNTTQFDFTITDSDIYIEPVYTKITYKVNFKVDERGVIYDNLGNKIDAPITLEYGDNYTLKIVANKGYEINKILVNNKEYELINDSITIENVTNDTIVEVTFKLKTYTIKIDGIDYKVSYGTTYEELLKMINTDKDGYTFKGLRNNEGHFLDKDYIVEDDITLITVYEKNDTLQDKNFNNSDNDVKENDNNVKDNIKDAPDTRDSIFTYVVLFIVSLISFISIVKYKKLFKKNKD